MDSDEEVHEEEIEASNCNEKRQAATLSNIHPFADRVVVCGTAVKRIILPSRATLMTATLPQRSKTNYAAVLHLKRFALSYLPEAEGMEFLAGDDIKEAVFSFIFRLLQQRGQRSMPLGDLGHCQYPFYLLLGMGVRLTIHFHCLFHSQVHGGEQSVDPELERVPAALPL